MTLEVKPESAVMPGLDTGLFEHLGKHHKLQVVREWCGGPRERLQCEQLTAQSEEALKTPGREAGGSQKD